MLGAASTLKSSGDALAATAVQHSPTQQDAASAAEPLQGALPVQAAMRSRGRVSAQPTAAETSTECFARLEALAGQPEGFSGMRCLLSISLK